MWSEVHFKSNQSTVLLFKMLASLIFIGSLVVYVNCLLPIKDEKFASSIHSREAKYCFLPPYPEHGRYIVSDYPSVSPGESYPYIKLDVSCDIGYINGNVTNSIMCINGFWSAAMPSCVPCGLIPQDRKLEGSSSNYVDLPWHAVIYDKKSDPYNYRCGGSIITANKIISAAYCFVDHNEKLLPASVFMVAVNRLYGSYKDPEERYNQQFDVVNIQIPTGYQGKAANYKDNIAIVIVERPFIFYPSLRPVCVDFDNNLDKIQLKEGNSGKAFSWSIAGDNPQTSPMLNIVDLPYIKFEDCYDMSPIKYQNYLTKDNFCAVSSNGSWYYSYYDRGTGIAFLDSSTQRHYLRGVVSFMFATADNKTTVDVFTSINKKEHFIKQYL